MTSPIHNPWRRGLSAFDFGDGDAPQNERQDCCQIDVARSRWNEAQSCWKRGLVQARTSRRAFDRLYGSEPSG